MSKRAAQASPSGLPRCRESCACSCSPPAPAASAAAPIAARTSAPRSPAGSRRRLTWSASTSPRRASPKSTTAISTRRAMPRNSVRGARSGSPWTGLGAVIAKETADHLGGARMVLIEGLMFLIALVVAWFSATAIRQSIGESPFLFLRLLTVTPEAVPLSVVSIIGLVTPVIAIALGFDAINGEFNQRTLSRLLAQPIYRDALLVGKFLARLLALTIALVSLWLLVLGLGILRFGLPPNFQEVVRMLGFLVATIAYGGVWLAIAVLFSVLFRAPATAALAAFGLWLVLAFFWSLMITPVVSTLIAGPSQGVFGPNPD